MASFLTPIAYLLKPISKRFVAGETAEEAIVAAEKMNAQGIRAILDFLGEDVFSEADARNACEEYIRLIHLIHRHSLMASVSLKVSQMGLLISKELCVENIRRVAREAAQLNRMVWFDMEGSALTQKTIDVFEQVRREYANVGLCLQAYLVRTGGDMDTLLRSPFRVRLCKGAYKEPSQIAYAAKKAVDGNFRMLVQKAVEQIPKGAFPAFATHDKALLDWIVTWLQERNVPRDRFEFQMLYGVQNRLLKTLVDKGFQGSVYIPYGTHWLPYFLRRLRERKENLYFLLRNLF